MGEMDTSQQELTCEKCKEFAERVLKMETTMQQVMNQKIEPYHTQMQRLVNIATELAMFVKSGRHAPALFKAQQFLKEREKRKDGAPAPETKTNGAEF